MTGGERVEDVLRAHAPAVLGALARRHDDFAACEDAAQEALLAAAQAWPTAGVPGSPRGWLLTVAERRLVDRWRADGARRGREVAEAVLAPPPGAAVAEHDDALRLLVLCCHPALAPPAQLALTLRAVGGLRTAEVASALLVPEATIAQRIVRAKAAIRAAGARFELPGPEELPTRLQVVVRVLYLVFNEGHMASSGDRLVRVDLAEEAIRLARQLRAARPRDPEVCGLLALMLLVHARRATRTDADGRLVALAEQDRSRWDAAAIAQGVALVEEALGHGTVGPLALQAAIAALHAEATDAEATDWPQIAALFRLLEAIDPSPVVTLNRAVAVGMADDARAGLALLGPLAGDPRMADHHRLHAVRAFLLERAGDASGAAAAYREAARGATSVPEQRHLRERAAALAARA